MQYQLLYVTTCFHNMFGLRTAIAREQIRITKLKIKKLLYLNGLSYTYRHYILVIT